LQPHYYQDEGHLYGKQQFGLPVSPGVNIDRLKQLLSHLEKPHHDMKTHKHTQSQTRLEVPLAFIIPGPSPKLHYGEAQTERQNNHHHKNQENIEVSPFDITKYIKPTEYTLRVLTPANRNLCIEEPRRPKILNKQKQLTFF
jgi:hypothetical protein